MDAAKKREEEAKQSKQQLGDLQSKLEQEEK
jgi:hypothetical protein